MNDTIMNKTIVIAFRVKVNQSLELEKGKVITVKMGNDEYILKKK